jgi:hypothetical protein
MSDCTRCRNTQILFYLIEILGDHKFLSGVTECWETLMSDCTISTALILVEVVSCNFAKMFHTITILVFLVNIIPKKEIKSYLFYRKYFLKITG